MQSKMLRFIDTDREMPEKRPAETRTGDFHEIYGEYIKAKAEEQAGRCSQCGIPFCQVHCPLHNNIPDWLMLTAAGRLEEAYEISQATNTFPEICGRICPQDRLCEGYCVIEQSGHGTVTIGAVEKYITDTAWDNGWVKPVKPSRNRDETVGIIGAGPAGLAAADQLRRNGYQVTVYDRYDRMGGLMVYGIPGFKLEKHVVGRRIGQLADSGVNFVTDVNVGETVSFQDLQNKHDALLIATGVYKARSLNVPGVGMPGVIPALTYLTASNKVGLGDIVPDYENGVLNAKDKRVVVIGGGDTAMDCVRTAVRQGAQSVKCLYRRDKANMPGSSREVSHAEEEGVIFQWLSAPRAITGDGSVTAVRAIQMQLGLPDASGRQTPVEIEGSDFSCEADMVIKALGFDAEPLPKLFDAPDLDVTPHGTVAVDSKTLMTCMEGVFAAGDIVRGASLVVWAILDGRNAAASIHKYLQNRAAVKGSGTGKAAERAAAAE